MSGVGQIERKTQQRVVKLFREQLGYLFTRPIISEPLAWVNSPSED